MWGGGWAVEIALELGYLLFHKNNMVQFSFRIFFKLIAVFIITELSGRNTQLTAGTGQAQTSQMAVGRVRGVSLLPCPLSLTVFLVLGNHG